MKVISLKRLPLLLSLLLFAPSLCGAQKPQLTLQRPIYYVSALAFSHDGRILATGSNNAVLTSTGIESKAAVLLWAVDGAKQLKILTSTSSGYCSYKYLAFDPSGVLLAGRCDGDVSLLNVWKVRTGELVRTEDYSLFDGDRPTGLLTAKLREGSDPVFRHLLTQMSPTVMQLMTGNKGFDSLSDEEVKELDAFNAFFRKSPLYDEQRFAHVKLTDETLNALSRPPCPEQPTRYDPNCQDVGQLNRRLLEEAAIASILKTLNIHFKGGDSRSVDSPDGKVRAVIAADRLKLSYLVPREVVEEAQRRGIKPPEPKITEILYKSRNPRSAPAVAFAPDGKFIISDGTYDTVNLWDLNSGERKVVEGEFSAAPGSAWSQDGKLLVLARGDFPIEVYDSTNSRWTEFSEVESTKIITAAISQDNKTVAGGGMDGSIWLWDANTGQVRGQLSTYPSYVSSLSFHPSGKFLASSYSDGTIKLWNIATRLEVVTLVSFDSKEWATITPDGRYDTSLGGKDYLHFVVGEEVIALEQLKERYYDPNLLPKLLGYNKEPLRDINAFKDVKLYPAAYYEPPPPDSTKLALKLTDRGGGIGRVQVLVNGKEVVADARRSSSNRLNKNATQLLITVDLAGTPYIPGQANEIRVVTWNAEGYIASRGEVRTWLPLGTSNTADPRLYAIVVGVSNYSSPAIKLSLPDRDAATFAQALEIGAKRLFGEGNTHVTLFNASGNARAVAPLKANIKKAFEEIASKARPWDIFVVYLSGHGTGLPNSDSYFYLTQEARSFNDLYDPGVRELTTISSDEMTEWIKRIPALKQTMILDTCAAGQAATKLADVRAASGAQIRAIERLKDRTGFHVLMGSAPDAVSWEASQYGHGLLTYSLLLGMRGAALRQDEFVDISPLFQYAADLVPSLAQDIGGDQRPIISAPRGTSFDIGRLDRRDKAAIPMELVRALVLRPLLMNPDEGTDNLSLIPALVKSLYESSAGQGEAPSGNANTQPIQYVNADEIPGAIRPTGTYTIEGQQVSVRLFLVRDGRKFGPLHIKGPANDQDALVSLITKTIVQAIPQFYK